MKHNCKLLTVLLILLGISACEKPATGIIAEKPEFMGVISADEPQAALAGRDILSNGGNAIDAATTMSLVMAVTLPSRVGLTGGGVCQYYDNEAKGVDTLNFMPFDENGEATFIPTFPRGIYALYAKGGSKRWEELVIPAEKIARFGGVLSKALFTDYTSTKYQQIKNKTNLEVGANYKNLELAATLSRLRTYGVGDFYTGFLADRIIKNYHKNDVIIDATTYRNYVPKWSESRKIQFGNESLYFADLKGSNLMNSWKRLVLTNQIDDVAADNNKGLNEAYKGAGFAAADIYGNMVACNFTIGKLFGEGTYYNDIGVYAASAIATYNSANLFSNSIIVNNYVNESRFSAVASGNNSNRDMILFIAEKNSPKWQYDSKDLTSVHCPKGLPPNPDSCRFYLDEDGNGYGEVIGTLK